MSEEVRALAEKRGCPLQDFRSANCRRSVPLRSKELAIEQAGDEKTRPQNVEDEK
jgi:hypothetical protein